MRFRVFREDGTEVHQGDTLSTSRSKDTLIFQSCTHPRKVFVAWEEDPNGPDYYPNLYSQDFYANVLNVGIWDTEFNEWSFAPNRKFIPNLGE